MTIEVQKLWYYVEEDKIFKKLADLYGKGDTVRKYLKKQSKNFKLVQDYVLTKKHAKTIIESQDSYFPVVNNYMIAKEKTRELKWRKFDDSILVEYQGPEDSEGNPVSLGCEVNHEPTMIGEWLNCLNFGDYEIQRIKWCPQA